MLMNNKKLKILCLEDSEVDVVIIRERLIEEGLIFQFDHVSNGSEFADKLKSEDYDIILSDYNLPGFNGIAALLLSKKLCPDVPFICISGTIGEDIAVELIHLGAADYIIKDKLSKLSVAIQRALLEVKERKARQDAEVSLRESEERFRNIMLSTYDWVWEIDREWKYCYSSERIQNILGYTPDGVIGKSPFDFMPPEEQKIVGPAFFECVRLKGVVKDIENWNIHKDGHLVCLLTNGFPIFDESDNLIGYRGVNKDVTEHKLAVEEIRKLSRATEQSSVSIIITDLNGNITYANPKVFSLTGYSFEELVGKNPRIFKSGTKLTEEYKILWNTIKSGNEWKGEFHNIKKNGELYWESASISPILNEKGEMTHFLAVKEDITERKKLTIELIEAKTRAEASDRLKTAFLNNISHEIRTPLNGILGFSELAIQPDLQQEEKNFYLKILNESSDRLLNTITNYMDISLIVSGNMTFISKPFDIKTILDNIYEKYLPKCKSKNLEFIKQFPSDLKTPFTGDDVLLEKAISHLVDNAVKFTEKGSVKIGLYLSNGGYEIFVKDTGSGISAEAQNNVFEFFRQEEYASSRDYEGSGLGLTIAKGLIELMGGRIRLESEKDKGSSFYIALYPEAESELITETVNEIEKDAKVDGLPVVLIVENDEFNAQFLMTIMQKMSFKYLVAVNGMEAVELCRTHSEISLVLMDIRMPVMDGLEATRKIKEFRKNLPVIGVSANAMAGDKEKSIEAGCDEYLTKPVRSGLLLSVINKHLGKY